MTRVGVTYPAARPPEMLPAFAAAAEAAGFDELWLSEDCFLAGGIAASAIALAATRHLRVGLGIMPAVFRNPAATAMEIATLARVHPERFIAGLGHGMPAWMDQIGALPAKPLRALEETTLAIRRLLAGELVTTDGDHVRLRDVRLAQPPVAAPPVFLGVRRVRGLRASGRSADGTILAEPAPASYIRWARAHIDEGRAEAAREDRHPLVVFVNARVDADRSEARRSAAAAVLSDSAAVQLAPLGCDAELARLRALGSAEKVAKALSHELLDQLTASGPADAVAAALRRLVEAGADTLALVPLGPDPHEQLPLLIDAARADAP